MSNILENSAFFGVVISLITYGIGVLLKEKFRLAIFNPLLVSIVLTICILKFGGIDYDKYYDGAKYLSYLLTPATVCLAIPLYEQFQMLKDNWKAICSGIFSGVLINLICIYIMAKLFKLNHVEYVTLLTKSITTAIGMSVSEELGGTVTIAVAVIIITGVLGNIIAQSLFKVLKIDESVAKGIALGTASHAIGTSRAMEMGEVEGAMSSLSIVVAGLLTVIEASFFAQFI